MENYSHELKEQNRKKNGRPFTRPDKIIEFFARVMAVFSVSFWSMESNVRIFQGISKIKVPEIVNSPSTVAIMLTGFNTTIRGDWLSGKWYKK